MCTFLEIIKQIEEIKSLYEDTRYEFIGKHGIYNIYVSLKPTEYSKLYTIKLTVKKGKKCVSVYPVQPRIGTQLNGKAVPHMYSNGSLCLFYRNEWDFSDSWAKTLIPWTCLWLYYYELWVVTGEWLGGGIHVRKKER